MKLSVIGAGYVGLTTAACLAHVGHDVFCSESDLHKLEKLQSGVMPIFEPHLEGVIRSAQDAGHLAAELMGRFAFDRPGLAAISLPDATAAMTAIGNDYSYDQVFARQVLAVGRPGDVVVGLTTSGNSVNVVSALEAAAHAGMITVALTGAGGGKAAHVAKIAVQVPTGDTARAQEACLHFGHTICEMVEAALFSGPT